MWDNLIGRQIRRGARRLVFWNALLLGVLLVAVVCSARYWYNFALGPFPLGRDALLDMKSADGLTRYFVVVTADAAVDSGGRLFEVRKDRSGRELSRTEQARFVFLTFDDRALVAKADVGAAAGERRRAGQLVALPDDVRRDVISPVEAEMAQRGGEPLVILPVMLDATPFRTTGWVGLAFFVPLAALGFWNIVRGVRRLANPERSPLARGLLRYGDPATVAEQVERECRADGHAQFGPATVTKNWLVYAAGTRLQLVRLGDLAWVYKAVTRHATNGVPTRTTFAAILCDLNGNKVTVPLAEALTDPLLIAVNKRVPWVLVGYDRSLDGQWKANPADLAAILDQRRQQIVDAIRTEQS